MIQAQSKAAIRRSCLVGGVRIWAGLLLLPSLIDGPAHAQRIDKEIQLLRTLLQKPESEIDLALVKLTIDQHSS